MSIHDAIKNALSIIVAMSITTTATADSTSQAAPMMGEIKGMERCFGISKAHLNDCSTALHNCAGAAEKDGSKSEWVLLPTGLCTKIVGGSTKSQDEKKTS